VKTRLPFSNPYKYGWITWPEHEENWIKKSAGHRRHARWSSPLSFLLLPFILHAVP